MIKTRSVELALVRLPLEHRGLTYHHLLNEPFLFVTNQKTKISLKEISHFPLIIPSTENLGIYNTIIEAFARHKLHLNKLAECSDMHTLIELVRGGIGATIVPKSVLDIYGDKSLFATPLNDINLTSSLGFLYLENHYISTPAKNFMRLMKDCYGHS